MERFKAQPGEKILMKGPLRYFKSKWRSVACQGILTSKRFVMGRRLMPLWSVIPRLYSRIRGKKIVFQIPLLNFHSIKSAKGNFFTIKATDGTEYPIMPEGLFGKKDRWIGAIILAVKEVRPEIKIKSNADLIEFSKS